MVEILRGKGSGRRVDARARQLIESNRSTIARIADRLTQGGVSSGQTLRQPPAAPRSRPARPRPAATQPDPYIRISPNGRVVVVDAETSRQMSFLGELRRRDGVERFVLATRANGFFAPLEAEAAEALAPLDGRTLTDGFGEEALAEEIARRLALP